MAVEIPLTRGYVALVDEQDAHLAERRWHAVVSGNGRVYAKRDTRIRGRPISFYLHREIAGAGVGMVVDHINGDGLDNRRANLRVVATVENIRNVAGPRADNTSGYLGVTFDRARGLWQAKLKAGGKYVFLGRFKTADEANAARLAGEAEHFGIQPRRAAAHCDNL